jgi:hypothetical protein
VQRHTPHALEGLVSPHRGLATIALGERNAQRRKHGLQRTAGLLACDACHV